MPIEGAFLDELDSKVDRLAPDSGGLGIEIGLDEALDLEDVCYRKNPPMVGRLC